MRGRHRVSCRRNRWRGTLCPVGRVIDIYGGKDPRDLPRYSTAEAAHYLRLPRATLKTWVHGRVDSNGHRAEAVIKLPTDSQLLSFQNLVEAHVLSAIRRHHGVSLQRVRKALRFVERRMHLPRPLIAAKFQTNGMDLFVEELGKLINASSEGQTEMDTRSERRWLESSTTRTVWRPGSSRSFAAMARNRKSSWSTRDSPSAVRSSRRPASLSASSWAATEQAKTSPPSRRTTASP
jgi:hypothetical protein